jgi:hypothetical protein
MPQLLLSFLNTGKWLLVLHLYYYFLIDETYRNDNLLYYPEAYQRLQETVRSDPKLTLLESNTHFTIISDKPLSSSYSRIIVFVIGFIILYLKKVLGSWFDAPAIFVIPKYW